MAKIYTWFVLFGFGTVAAAILMGFRHDPAAPAINYAYNAGLMAAYMLVHYVMMTPGFKKMVCGDPSGSAGERRVYMLIAILTWVAVYAVHWPLPGPAYVLPIWVTYVATSLFLMGFFAFNEGATFDSIKGFSGVPGFEQTHGAAGDAPLQTGGSYASVRHPMYRGFFYMALASIIIHPNGAQLAWALLLVFLFVAFIPIEEKQLLEGKGEAYRQYMEQTPYRILKGIW